MKESMPGRYILWSCLFVSLSSVLYICCCLVVGCDARIWLLFLGRVEEKELNKRCRRPVEARISTSMSGSFTIANANTGKGTGKKGLRDERKAVAGKERELKGKSGRERVGETETQSAGNESVGNGSGSGARDETGRYTDTQRHCSPSGAENHRLGADVASTTSWHLHRRKQAGSHHRIRPS